MSWARRLALPLALAALLGACLCPTDPVLAASVVSDDPAERDLPERLQDSIDEAVNRDAVLPLFVLLGIILPWSTRQTLGWTAAAFAAIVLLLRRTPLLVAVASSALLQALDALFMGWFGRVG